MRTQPSVRDLSASIVLTGQGRWAGELATGLEEYSALKVGLAPFDRASAALDSARWRALASAETLVVVGFRPGARTLRGVLFDSAFALVQRVGPPKRVVYYWIGTDVQHAIDDLQAERETVRFTRAAVRAEHFAGSANLVDELADVGVHAERVDFPWLGMPKNAGPLPMPDRFTVLSYVPDARASFYGGPELIAAAAALPSVEFLIVGGTGDWAPQIPTNVRFLGWQDEMRPWYAASSCVVRLVEHDSIGGTIVEALAYGRAALYSHHLEHATFVPFGDVRRLVEALAKLASTYRGHATPPDVTASAWALREFDPQRLFDRLAERLVDARELGAALASDDEPSAGADQDIGGR